ncbi:MAG TPA: hypothetical protein VIM96_06560, partial [Pseudomonadales bacterium]
MTVFRHPADRVPAVMFCCLTVVDFAVYFSVSNIGVFVAYWLLMMLPKGIISAWNHHHQHTRTFHSTA